LAGARREIRLGCIASTRLKPTKKKNISTPSVHSPGACGVNSQKASCTTHSSAMPMRSTVRMWPRRSAENNPPIIRNEARIAGRYRCQCCALASPACTSRPGTTTHIAICTVCSTNTPRSSRHRRGCSHTSCSRPRGTSTCCTGSPGVNSSTTAMPAIASAAVSQNRPPNPIAPVSGGAATSDSANMAAMLMPTSAIALVRTSSRVRSASSAVTAADTAPAPCSARPATSICTLPASAAMALPSANTTRPATITFLRPMRSEASPSGTCITACVSP